MSTFEAFGLNLDNVVISTMVSVAVRRSRLGLFCFPRNLRRIGERGFNGWLIRIDSSGTNQSRFTIEDQRNNKPF